MKGAELFGKEKAGFNLARIRKAGERFEVVVDPDNAVAFRDGSLGDVREALSSEKVFADAKKGLESPESSLKRAFGSSDVLKVAGSIIREGEIQLTAQYRDSLRAAKRGQIVQLIHQNAIDPRTNAPHPAARIENAMAEAGVKIDESRSAEDQTDGIVKKLQPVIPIRFETRTLQFVVPATHASRSYGLLKAYGRVVRNSWHSDGTLFAVVQIPAGRQQELSEKLNRIAHGNIDIKTVEGES